MPLLEQAPAPSIVAPSPSPSVHVELPFWGTFQIGTSGLRAEGLREQGRLKEDPQLSAGTPIEGYRALDLPTLRSEFEARTGEPLSRRFTESPQFAGVLTEARIDQMISSSLAVVEVVKNPAILGLLPMYFGDYDFKTREDPETGTEIIAAGAGGFSYGMGEVREFLNRFRRSIGPDGKVSGTSTIPFHYTHGAEEREVEVAIDFDKGTVHPPIIVGDQPLTATDIASFIRLFTEPRFDGQPLAAKNVYGEIGLNRNRSYPTQSALMLRDHSDYSVRGAWPHEIAHALYHRHPEYVQMIRNFAARLTSEQKLEATVFLAGLGYDLAAKGGNSPMAIDEALNAFIVGGQYDPERKLSCYPIGSLAKGLGANLTVDSLNWKSLEEAPLMPEWRETVREYYLDAQKRDPNLTEEDFIKNNPETVLGSVGSLGLLMKLLREQRPDIIARMESLKKTHIDGFLRSPW